MSRAAAVLCTLVLVGCGEAPSPTSDPLETVEEVRDEIRAVPPPEVVVASNAPGASAAPRIDEEAPALDVEYAGDAMLQVRSLVYRFSLRRRVSIGGGSDTVPEPVTELRVDVTPDRLRARFVGTAWPVPAGSEIRMRRDVPGAYLFDPRGGRHVGAGMIAQWFEGGALPGEADLRFRTTEAPKGATEQAVATMFCRLLAEWANGSPDAYSRRCATGIPVTFYFGAYYVERTAELYLRAPRSSMRADHLVPPEVEGVLTSRAYHRPEILARIAPNERTKERRSRAPDAGEPSDTGLVVENRSSTRLVISVEGNAVGWVDAGATATFPGLRPGTYGVGGGRPLGGRGAAVRLVAVPGTTRLPR